MIRRLVRASLAALLAAGGGGARAEAQVPDSSQIYAGAREAQASFELTRRGLLQPYRGKGGGRCDEQFGNFCYWYDGDKNALPEQDPRIATARQALLADLAARAERIPGDQWIVGQRVRYLVEAEDFAGAVAVAQACPTRDWWCDALRGYAFHAIGQYARADTFFRRSYLRSSLTGRCIWEDLSPLFDEATARQYLALDCNARRPINQRYLWLADPYFGDSINDLATEIRARQVHHRLLENATNAYGVQFSHDEGDMIMRYGWAIRWTRSGREVQGHEARPAFIYGPLHWWEGDVLGPEWNMNAARPRLRYATPWAHRFIQLEDAQSGLFRHIDSTLVAAAFRLPDDSDFGAGSIGVVSLARNPETPPAVSKATATDRIVRLLTPAPWYPAIVELAVRDTLSEVFARDRVAVDPQRPTRPGLSDVLFIAADTLPTRLDEAVGVALPSLRFTQGASVGIFWEEYGFPAGVIDFSLLAVQAEEPISTRLGGVRPIPKGKTPIRIAWKDDRPARPLVDGHSLGVDLSRLEPGRYALVLEVKTADGRTARSVRGFDILKVEPAK